MQSPALVRVVVSVASLDDALAFYSDLIGLPVLDRGEELASLDLGSAPLLLHQRPPQSSRSAVAVCLAVVDLDGMVRAWQDRGGEVIDAPADQPWGERMAVVADPDGHVVCLVQGR